jgi:hypothetical protein
MTVGEGGWGCQQSLRQDWRGRERGWEELGWGMGMGWGKERERGWGREMGWEMERG